MRFRDRNGPTLHPILQTAGFAGFFRRRAHFHQRWNVGNYRQRVFFWQFGELIPQVFWFWFFAFHVLPLLSSPLSDTALALKGKYKVISNTAFVFVTMSR